MADFIYTTDLEIGAFYASEIDFEMEYVFDGEEVTDMRVKEWLLGTARMNRFDLIYFAGYLVTARIENDAVEAWHEANNAGDFKEDRHWAAE
jgi:hypothetical protein